MEVGRHSHAATLADTLVATLADTLADTMAFQNLSSKFNSALDVPAKGFCELPAEQGK